MQLSRRSWVAFLTVLCFAISATGTYAAEKKEGKDDEQKIGSKVNVIGTIAVEKKEIEKKKEKDWPIESATLSADGGATYHILLDSKGKSLAKKMTKKDMADKKIEVKGTLVKKPAIEKDAEGNIKQPKKDDPNDGEKWVKVSSSKEVKEEKKKEAKEE